jgi:hypothetical protein
MNFCWCDWEKTVLLPVRLALNYSTIMALMMSYSTRKFSLMESPWSFISSGKFPNSWPGLRINLATHTRQRLVFSSLVQPWKKDVAPVVAPKLLLEVVAALVVPPVASPVTARVIHPVIN